MALLAAAALTAVGRRTDLTALPGGLWAVGLVVAVAAAGLSTVMSNTATAALLVPTALALSLVCLTQTLLGYRLALPLLF